MTRRHLLILLVPLLSFVVPRADAWLARDQAWHSQHRAAGTARADETFDAAVASAIAARTVAVRCAEFASPFAEEPQGMVRVIAGRPVDYTVLRPDICTALTRFRERAASLPPPRACSTQPACMQEAQVAANALKTLAHESQHLRGITSEATAECYGMQAVPQAARAFGATEEEAAFLAHVVFVLEYPAMPPDYRSPECRPGGQLDLPNLRWLQ